MIDDENAEDIIKKITPDVAQPVNAEIGWAGGPDRSEYAYTGLHGERAGRDWVNQQLGEGLTRLTQPEERDDMEVPYPVDDYEIIAPHVMRNMRVLPNDISDRVVQISVDNHRPIYVALPRTCGTDVVIRDAIRNLCGPNANHFDGVVYPVRSIGFGGEVNE